ncbi:thiamine diphosphokinase [Phyllobacterium salinisoli]|uniref:Thiamine diphosphokinase n=1 Tax=Phyllobacterium salinisoli TaxID=1899321 RepID=A0A368K5L3_9HYPH|nr:thiamine diphosphokinase [Phyllobacterium salinisoli]RCS23662.1 thiamine diphosphokinase [Phyllobacterium salinisoli]
MSRFLILLGGHLTVTERLKRQIAGARVLAADSGMRHAAVLGVEPELWLGDFDSTAPALARRYKHVPRRTFPPAKDMTDGELALHEAFALGATSVILCGAFGGSRTDHTMLHLTMATAQAAKGREIFLSSGVEEAWPILPGTHAPDLPDGALFSIIGFTTLEGLTITSVEWPLDNVKVPFGSSLTVSNVVKGTLGVLLRSGCGVLVATLEE